MRSKWLCLLSVGVLAACDGQEPIAGPEYAVPAWMTAAAAAGTNARADEPVSGSAIQVVDELANLVSEEITIFSTAAAFAAAGEIAFTTDFERDFDGQNDIYYPAPNPWPFGGVTYQSGFNVVLRPTAGAYTSSIVCHFDGAAMLGSVDPGYDMLGFDFVLIGVESPVDITITTTAANYEFADLDVPLGTSGAPFFGFVTKTEGEEITGFRLEGVPLQTGPCMDNVMVGVASRMIQVAVDIKPGSERNPVHPESSGVLPVAVLSTDGFDASTVDVSTVALGGVGVAQKKNATFMASLEDVDGDGTPDLAVKFRIQDLVNAGALTAETTSLALTGETTADEKFRGSDVVTVVR